MEQFATNDTLFHNIKAAFGVKGTPRVKEFERDSNTWKWKLTLDIWGKIITLSADMKVGYFTQCVNHTVILENIQAESEGFTMKYDSVTWGAEKVLEGTWGINIWTCNFNLHLFGVFDKGDKWPQKGDTPPSGPVKPSNTTGSEPTNWSWSWDRTIPEQDGRKTQ